MCLCVQIQLTARLNNPSQRRRGFEQVRDEQNITVSSSEKLGKNHPVVPPLDHFQGENINCSSLARTISTSRGSFFANLTTFERCSGLKKISHLKIAILKMGWLWKFQSHRSWGDTNLSLGALKSQNLKVLVVFPVFVGKGLTCNQSVQLSWNWDWAWQ